MFLIVQFPTCDNPFQPLAKVGCADAGVDNREQDENNRYDGKGSQRFSDWFVCGYFLLRRVIHSNDFIKEICKATKIECLGGESPVSGFPYLRTDFGLL